MRGAAAPAASGRSVRGAEAPPFGRWEDGPGGPGRATAEAEATPAAIVARGDVVGLSAGRRNGALMGGGESTEATRPSAPSAYVPPPAVAEARQRPAPSAASIPPPGVTAEDDASRHPARKPTADRLRERHRRMDALHLTDSDEEGAASAAGVSAGAVADGGRGGGRGGGRSGVEGRFGSDGRSLNSDEEGTAAAGGRGARPSGGARRRPPHRSVVGDSAHPDPSGSAEAPSRPQVREGSSALEGTGSLRRRTDSAVPEARPRPPAAATAAVVSEAMERAARRATSSERPTGVPRRPVTSSADGGGASSGEEEAVPAWLARRMAARAGGSAVEGVADSRQALAGGSAPVAESGPAPAGRKSAAGLRRTAEASSVGTTLSLPEEEAPLRPPPPQPRVPSMVSRPPLPEPIPAEPPQPSTGYVTARTRRAEQAVAAPEPPPRSSADEAETGALPAQRRPTPSATVSGGAPPSSLRRPPRVQRPALSDSDDDAAPPEAAPAMVVRARPMPRASVPAAQRVSATSADQLSDEEEFSGRVARRAPAASGAGRQARTSTG